jgi:hypothetical protein
MSSWKRIASWKHNTEDMAADTAALKWKWRDSPLAKKVLIIAIVVVSLSGGGFFAEHDRAREAFEQAELERQMVQEQLALLEQGHAVIAGRRATVSSSCRPDYRSPTDCRWYCQRRVDPPSRRRRGRAERTIS